MITNTKIGQDGASHFLKTDNYYLKTDIHLLKTDMDFLKTDISILFHYSLSLYSPVH